MSAIQCNLPGPREEKSGHEICVDRNKKVVKEAHWKRGKLEGAFWCFREGGQNKIEAFYKDDLLDGEYKETYPKENRWTLQNYRKGRAEGIRSEKLPDGNSRVSFYRNDAKYGFTYIVSPAEEVLHALECEIDHAGLPKEKCEALSIPEMRTYEKSYAKLQAEKAKESAKNFGERIEKYPNGKLRAKYFLSPQGQREGDSIEYYENGQIKSEAKYRKSVKVERETRYLENGTKQFEIQYGERSMETESTEYYMNKKVKFHSKFLGFLPNQATPIFYRVQKEEYHPNGELAYRGQQIVSRAGYRFTPDGKQEYFYDDGSPSTIMEWQEGKKSGTWTYFQEDKRVEIVYEKGELRKETVFDPKTQAKKKETTFLPDGSVEKETRF